MSPTSMHDERNNPRGHAKWYWIAWLVLLFVLILVRALILPNLGMGQSIDFRQHYIIGMWIVIIAANLYEGNRLMSYLREHHYEKWAILTTFPGLGPGGRNPFRTIPWFFSSETLGDPVMADMKSDYRWFIVWCLAAILTLPIFGR